MRKGTIAGLLLTGLICSAPAEAADPIGLVKTAKGEIQVTRNGTTTTLAAGQDVFGMDEVKTGAQSALGITFKDDTTLSLGPNGLLVLDNLVFDPANNSMGMTIKMVSGTFAMITGQIPKLAPDNMKITTPTATIGIRGTSILVEVTGD